MFQDLLYSMYTHDCSAGMENQSPVSYVCSCAIRTEKRRERRGREDLAQEVYTPRNYPGRRRRFSARRLRGWRVRRQWIRWRLRWRRRLQQVLQQRLEGGAGFGRARHRPDLRGVSGIGRQVPRLGTAGSAGPPGERRLRCLLGGLHAQAVHGGLQKRATRLSLPRLDLRPGERGRGGERSRPATLAGDTSRGSQRGGFSGLAALKLVS
jgi:hypothetical protein